MDNLINSAGYWGLGPVILKLSLRQHGPVSSSLTKVNKIVYAKGHNQFQIKQNYRLIAVFFI